MNFLFVYKERELVCSVVFDVGFVLVKVVDFALVLCWLKLLVSLVLSWFCVGFALVLCWFCVGFVQGVSWQ